MINKTSKKKKGIQIGNFIVTFDTGNLKAVKITSVAENWNVRYREDNILYAWILNELKTEEGREVLHLAFACWFAASNGIPDDTFLEDVVQAYTRSIERMKEGVKRLSEEEDQELLDKMKSDFGSPKPTTDNTH
ncbi:hypothetical protein CLV62_12049 [Dysgonomonas alginatilytica]|uniref:Tail assembly chaperone n=1 Tax=Dysgonomonas alginatilytica TaxID=1605892 RepID=A0A2V3PN04_9BACT|nr:hypothetical protein [Dysgonomonas alginatilytica]PXV62361.1 hypothetical protein CLV62_12049 [Dysgonomonas alginatilytica]